MLEVLELVELVLLLIIRKLDLVFFNFLLPLLVVCLYLLESLKDIVDSRG